MLVDMMIIHKVTLNTHKTKNVVCNYFDLLELNWWSPYEWTYFVMAIVN